MLNSLRKSAAGWLAKILFGLLVLSFALWGVGDWTSGFRREKLAEVGGREITQAEFERAYQTQLVNLSNQLGRQVTSAEARSLGLTQRVLQTLVGAAAVNIHAEKLNLGITDEAIAENIRREETFVGTDGKFNRQQFDDVLRANNLTEPDFVAMQRMEMIRGQIVDTLTQAPYAPRVLADAMHRYRNDERTLKYFILPPEAAGTLEKPGEDTLKAYYEDHKRSFLAPEFRRAGVLVASPEKLKDVVAVTDEDLKAAFESNKKAYSIPERRAIEQLIFPDKAAAENAARKLADGADFLQVGRDAGMKDTDITLGTFTKEDFGDRTVAEAAFKLEKDKPSGVIEGFSPVIVRVTEITPGTQKSFEDVKEEVKTQLAQARASEEISKLYDQIEDERAAGSSLSEIARKVNLEFEEITVNRQGVTRDGKKIDIAGRPQDVVKLIFESDVGVETNPVSLGDLGYAFVDMMEIIPERQKPFDEVRDDVAKVWAEEETRTRLTAKADELVAGIAKAQGIDAAAASVGASVKTTPSLKRTGAEPGLPISAIAQAFTLPKDGLASAQTADRKGRVVFQVAEIKPAPALEAKQAEELRAELSRGMGADVVAQYVTGLQTAYGVQVSPKAISDATGQQ